MSNLDGLCSLIAQVITLWGGNVLIQAVPIDNPEKLVCM